MVCNATAGRFFLFFADFVVLGAAQRGDSGFRIQLRGGNIRSKAPAKGASISKAMDGRGDGMYRRDIGAPHRKIIGAGHLPVKACLRMRIAGL